MHTSLLPVIFGEHSELVANAGIPPSLFIELETAERHALVCSLVNQRRGVKNLGSSVELLKYAASIDPLIVSGTKKIKCSRLWPAGAYRRLGRLVRCPNALNIFRHTEEVTEKSIGVLHALPVEWRRQSVVRLVNSPDQARALVSLGQTLYILFGDKRQEEFRELIERLNDASQIREKFYAFVFRSLDASRLPLTTTPFLDRVVSYSDCRRLAQMGHCFGDPDMVECVFAAESYFYAWSRRPGVVVEIEKDQFPFSWTIIQACKPKSRPLTIKETEALMADIGGLGVPVTTHRLSARVCAALEHFQ